MSCLVDERLGISVAALKQDGTPLPSGYNSVTTGLETRPAKVLPTFVPV